MKIGFLRSKEAKAQLKTSWEKRKTSRSLPSAAMVPPMPASHTMRPPSFLVLLDLIIECATDMLDHVGEDLERINRSLFQHHATRKHRLRIEASPRRRTHQLEVILTELGYCREVLVKLRRSVLSFRRVVILLQERDDESPLAGKLKLFEHELKALAEAEEDLSATNAFMLDGAVGYIGILQSKVINILTILGVLLTPPVLVASVYGMNFKHMPELDWSWGYPWALGLMAVSAVVMYVIVRMRGGFNVAATMA